MAAAVSRLEQQQVATGSESATLLESALSEVASLRAASLEGRAELAAAQLAASRAAQEAERWGSEHGAGLVAVGAAEGESGAARCLVCCSASGQGPDVGGSLTVMLRGGPRSMAWRAVLLTLIPASDANASDALT